MTRSEFLEKLGNALLNDLDSASVRENVNYYNQYIGDEAAKGRSEEEVIAELGDPWVIARSIIDAAESTAESGKGQAGYGQSGYEQYDTGRKQPENQQGYGQSNMHRFAFDSWWKKLLLVLGIIGVVLIIFAVIGGIFALVLPVILPILGIILVIRLFASMRR